MTAASSAVKQQGVADFVPEYNWVASRELDAAEHDAGPGFGQSSSVLVGPSRTPAQFQARHPETRLSVSVDGIA